MDFDTFIITVFCFPGMDQDNAIYNYFRYHYTYLFSPSDYGSRLFLLLPCL